MDNEGKVSKFHDKLKVKAQFDVFNKISELAHR